MTVAVGAFWDWWDCDGRAAAEAGIRADDMGSLVPQISARVRAIHPDLAWELGQGNSASYALVVTAGGIPEGRRFAELWYRAAPGATEAWEYQPARQPSPVALTATMEFSGHRLDLSQLLFDLRVDDDRGRIHAAVYHPAFARMRRKEPLHVAYLALDWALGEDGVVRWVGQVTATDQRPGAAVPAAAMVETVSTLAARIGDDRWALLRGERKGVPVVASVCVSARWVDHPLMDLHVEVKLPFGEQNQPGGPAAQALDQLRALEDEVTARFGPRMLLVAHETSAGVRTLHWYADSDDSLVASQVRDQAASWPGATVLTHHDPGWRAARHLLM